MGDVMAQFPYCGEVMINGCLQSQNVCRGKLKHIKRTCSYIAICICSKQASWVLTQQ